MGDLGAAVVGIGMVEYVHSLIDQWEQTAVLVIQLLDPDQAVICKLEHGFILREIMCCKR